MVSKDGSKNAYFRGRKLKGKSVKIPDGYSGAVLLTTDKTIGSTQITAPPPPPGYDVENDAEDEEMETDNAKTLEQVATFDEITLWGHDAAPSNTEDGYAKAIEEWVAFADTVRMNSFIKIMEANSLHKMHKCESVDKTS